MDEAVNPASIAVSISVADWPAAYAIGKSFLVLFFKKEHSFFFAQQTSSKEAGLSRERGRGFCLRHGQGRCAMRRCAFLTLAQSPE